MARTLPAVAVRLAAVQMRERERAREEIGRNGKAAQDVELALAQASSLRAFRLVPHLLVYIP